MQQGSVCLDDLSSNRPHALLASGLVVQGTLLLARRCVGGDGMRPRATGPIVDRSTSTQCRNIASNMSFASQVPMNKRRQTYLRNSLDLRDKVQVKVLRKRLKVSDQQFASIVRKSGPSIAAITKEAKVI
ncbi:DUF3606 domain-containing protein [Bradyrhizobium sp. 41S5]|uniref:DUF3606 domain-containing protein n=1 Tax=Bradyrhizobium sp. 41S5 TaxID=1404443 RepID=UPI001E3C39FB|nr:DUF3606 domain-containing protein [Bradyrhizobium sp. 41S5]UFX42280.1 DUF3606 domain-containing protein [Bradyrhizobium sp. 41S5]